ncbi:MAG TPA: phospholipase D-like domain-containing protein [Pseudogracilibacillus sp.]|nr:phospholipase D-like domain-containing protein [Pseudogracilibacillus sp.]
MSKIRKLFFPFSILLNMGLFAIMWKQQKHVPYRKNHSIESAFSESNHSPRWLLEQSISQARETLDIAIYNFDDAAIAESLIKAKHRGLHIRVLIDETKATKKKVKQLLSQLTKNGIPVRRYATGKMHLKMTIIDQTTLTIGSFNYTYASVNENIEQLFKVSNRSEALKWTAVFNELWDVSQS